MDDEALNNGHTEFDEMMAEGPTPHLHLSVSLLDQIDRARQVDELLDRAVEDVTGLKPSEVKALKLVDSGAHRLEDLADALGLVDDAAATVVDALIQRALLVRDTSNLLHLTEAGAAMVDRADAIRIRSADLASTRLNDHQIERLTATLDLMRGLSSERQLPRA
ncbi:hypothetical protein [Flaviflexus equikiangi]|nr:hypothetical protein [Flaviflexus equikiangi]